MTSRDERQAITVEKVRQSNCYGTVVACTGYGKTRIATTVLDKLTDKKGTISTTIVVPTDTLRSQWRRIIDVMEFQDVYVDTVQSIIRKGDIVRSTFTIYDEIHLYLNGNEFKKVFSLTQSIYKLGLTATLRSQERALLTELLPIVDTVTLDEAKRNGWVSDFIQYNILLDFDSQLRQQYNAMHTSIVDYFKYFNHNYDSARQCMFANGAASYLLEKDAELGERYTERVKGVLLTRDDLIKEYVKRANQFNRLVQKRKEVLYGADVKIQTAKQIIQALDMKTVTFGEVTEAADKLTAMLNADANDVVSFSFHSNIKSAEVPMYLLTYYKLRDIPKKYDPNKMIKCSKDTINQLGMAMLEANAIKIVNTAKALNVGLDVSKMQCAGILAGNTNPTNQAQRIGRVIRLEEIEEQVEKVAIVFNTVIKDSKDESWTEQRQKGMKNIVTVKSVKELLTHYYNYIK